MILKVIKILDCNLPNYFRIANDYNRLPKIEHTVEFLLWEPIVEHMRELIDRASAVIELGGASEQKRWLLEGQIPRGKVVRTQYGPSVESVSNQAGSNSQQ